MRCPADKSSGKVLFPEPTSSRPVRAIGSLLPSGWRPATFRCMLEVQRILGRDIGSITLGQWPYCLPAVMSALQSPAGMGSIRTVGAPGDLPAGQGLSGANRDCTLQNSGLG